MSPNPFEKQILETRLKLGETQTEFGKRFGVGPLAVSFWEKAKREAPYEVLYFVLGLTACDKCSGTGWLKEADDKK